MRLIDWSMSYMSMSVGWGLKAVDDYMKVEVVQRRHDCHISDYRGIRRYRHQEAAIEISGYQEELGRCDQGGPRFRAGPEEPDQEFQLALCPSVVRLDPPHRSSGFCLLGKLFSDGVFDT